MNTVEAKNSFSRRISLAITCIAVLLITAPVWAQIPPDGAFIPDEKEVCPNEKFTYTAKVGDRAWECKGPVDEQGDQDVVVTGNEATKNEKEMAGWTCTLMNSQVMADVAKFVQHVGLERFEETKPECPPKKCAVVDGEDIKCAKHGETPYLYSRITYPDGLSAQITIELNCVCPMP